MTVHLANHTTTDANEHSDGMWEQSHEYVPWYERFDSCCVLPQRVGLRAALTQPLSNQRREARGHHFSSIATASSPSTGASAAAAAVAATAAATAGSGSGAAGSIVSLTAVGALSFGTVSVRTPSRWCAEMAAASMSRGSSKRSSTRYLQPARSLLPDTASWPPCTASCRSAVRKAGTSRRSVKAPSTVGGS